MAGDWIKIRSDIFDDAAVMQMSDILGCDDTTMVGLLVRFWSWADRQTVDGHELRVTWARIDRLVERDGFSAAMLKIGWLAGEDGAVHLPKFDRHNGQSAKARAMEAEAKRIRRGMARSEPCPTPPPGGESERCPTSAAIPSDAMSDQRREEKRKRKSTIDAVEAVAAATSGVAVDFSGLAYRLSEAYARRDRSRPAVRAAEECLRRHVGRIPYEEILAATQAITEMVGTWPDQERIMYLPTATKFFSEDQWRRPVESWASRCTVQQQQQRQPVDIGGRKPELFRFQESSP